MAVRRGSAVAGRIRRARIARLRARLALLAAAVVAAGGASTFAAPAASAAEATEPDPEPVCAAEAPDESAAVAMAAACGTAVEALSERTEYTQVTVDSSGVATLVSAAVPQRVHRADGSWADVDTSLRRDASDGSWVPVATVADVRFSGGGAGPMATWREGPSTFTISWPGGPLPTPRIEGNIAIYEDVYQDVDLHVLSTVDGFQHVLVVKTLAAAANPALREIHYQLGGNVRAEPAGDGSLALLDGSGELVGATSGAMMWDSSVDPAEVGEQPAGAPLTDGGGSDLPDELVSNSARPGATAGSAPVTVTVADSNLVVIPDVAMLTDPNASLPIFIDPPFNKQRSKWAYATSNGENNDTTNARVGLNPTTGARYRSYFSFDTSAMRNTTVLSAKIQMELDHSWSCAATWVHLYRTGSWSTASGGRMSWSAVPLGSSATWLDSWQGNAHEGSPCNQPNATAVFEGSTLLNDVKTVVQGASSYWVGLCACNAQNQHESAQERWKRFETAKTYLIATYDLAPYKPVGLAHSTVTDCYKQCSSPAIVRTTQPTLRMSVQDPFGGTLLTAVEVRSGASDTAPIIIPNASLRVTISTPAVTSPGTSPAGTAAIQVPAGYLTNGNTYYWRATTRDENNLWSGWGAWQTLTVDTVAPALPSVTSTEYPFKQWGAQVGTPGTFTLGGVSDIYDFTWSVDSGPSTTVTATGTTSKTATAPHVPPMDHVHTLNVTARDIAGNVSGNFGHQFWVSPVPSRCWTWKLNETSGTRAADSGKAECSPVDSTVTAVDGTLSGTAAFATGYAGNGVTFTGSGGEISMGAATVDTSESFTVAAWVKPSNLSLGNQTVISQDGTNASRFQLHYDKDANGGAGGWCFSIRAADVVGAPVSACATGAVPDDEGNTHEPQDNVWVHVAGVYNAITGKIQIHVMGNPVSCSGEMVEHDFTGVWQTSGSFVIGRAKSGPSSIEHWIGGVDEVYAYPIALSTTKICQLASQ